MRLLELYDDFWSQYRYGYILDMAINKKNYNTENKINSTSTSTNTGNVRIITGNWNLPAWLPTYICWLPNAHFYSTGNDFYNTGTASRTGTIIFHGNITGTSAAKLGLPYPNTYNTSSH